MKQESKPIRVFVADDHAIIREGLARILESAPDICFMGAAGSGHEVLDQARDNDWDVLILDLSLPGSGESTLQSLQSICPDVAVIIYSMHPEDQYALRLLRAGASAYLTKGRASRELLDAIRKVAQGKKYITQELAAQLLEQNDDGQALDHELLTDREHQVFMLLIEGKQPGEIVRELHISASTVSTHIQHIKRKLNAPNTVALIKYAYRVGLLD